MRVDSSQVRADSRGMPDRRGLCGSAALRDESGFTLVVVIAVVGLLGLMAYLLSKTTSLDAKLAWAATRRAEAETIADGLARLAMRHLAINPPAEGRSGQLRLDGSAVSCRIGAATASLALTDADGLININLAGPDLLERLIAGVVGSKTEAANLASAIIDFRTIGDISSKGGSKQAAYDLAGLAHGPKMAPFESVAELEQVAGMTPDIVERLKPLVTVRSRFPTVNIKVASAAVLAALAGDAKLSPSDPASAELLRGSVSLPSELTFVPRTRSTQATNSKSVVIAARVQHVSGGDYTRQASVDLGSRLQSAAVVTEWSEAADAAVPPPPRDAAILPACVGGLLKLDPG